MSNNGTTRKAVKAYATSAREIEFAIAGDDIPSISTFAIAKHFGKANAVVCDDVWRFLRRHSRGDPPGDFHAGIMDNGNGVHEWAFILNTNFFSQFVEESGYYKEVII